MLDTITRSASETEAFGGILAQALAEGDVVFLRGDLGTGKTTLVRGACRALAIPGLVTSPTFTIGHLYEGGAVRIAHLDLYRFTGFSPAEWGDLEPYFDRTLAFVEWPDAGAAALPTARVVVDFAHRTPDERRLTIDSPDASLLEELARTWRP